MVSPAEKFVIDNFVHHLHALVWLRTYGASYELIHERALRLKAILGNLDVNKHYQEIGETLAALILTTVIKCFWQKNCQVCSHFTSCYTNDPIPSGPCKKFVNNDLLYSTRKLRFTEAVMQLDGAYGLDAPQILSVMHTYLDGMDASEPASCKHICDGDRDNSPL